MARLCHEETEQLEDMARAISGWPARIRDTGFGYALVLMADDDITHRLQMSWWLDTAYDDPAQQMLVFMQLQSPLTRTAEFTDFYKAVYDFSRKHARGAH